MLAKNAPQLEYRVVVIFLGASRGRVFRLQRITPEGDPVTLYSQPWPSGSPEAVQLQDIGVAIGQELVTEITTRWGVQGVLP